MTTAATPIAISITPHQKSLLVRMLGISETNRLAFWRPRGLGALPLPSGEKVGVRGRVTFDRSVPPHPDRFAIRPLPAGERWSKWRCLACGASSGQLLRPDLSLLHHTLPFLHFVFHEGAELGRAHLHDLGAFRGKLLLHLGRGLNRRQRRVHLVDDR